MVSVQIMPLSKNVYKDLFKFEQLNWDYFAKSIGSRPDSYRNYTRFCMEQDKILQQYIAGQVAFYLIYHKDKLI